MTYKEVLKLYMKLKNDLINKKMRGLKLKYPRDILPYYVPKEDDRWINKLTEIDCKSVYLEIKSFIRQEGAGTLDWKTCIPCKLYACCSCKYALIHGYCDPTYDPVGLSAYRFLMDNRVYKKIYNKDYRGIIKQIEEKIQENKV